MSTRIQLMVALVVACVAGCARTVASNPQVATSAAAPVDSATAANRAAQSASFFARTGFYERRARRRDDTFFAPENLEGRTIGLVSSLLEGASGFRVQQELGERRLISKGRNCEPAVFVDGQFIETGRERDGSDRGTLDDLVQGGDLYALEAYRYSPAEFQPRRRPGQLDCGVVVAWTRRYAPKAAKPAKPPRPPTSP